MKNFFYFVVTLFFLFHFINTIRKYKKNKERDLLMEMIVSLLIVIAGIMILAAELLSRY